MGLVGTNKGGGGDYIHHPSGAFPARLIDVIDLGRLKSVYNGKEKIQPKMEWRFWAGQTATKDGREIPLYVTQRLTVSTNEKAKARLLVEAVRGKKLTKAEEAAFDYESLLGGAFFINVVHNEVGERTYANLSSMMPVPNGMETPDEPEGYVREKNRPADKSKDVRATQSTPADEAESEPEYEFPSTDHDKMPWD